MGGIFIFEDVEDLRSLVKIMRPGEKRMLRYLVGRTTNSEDKLRLALFDFLDKHDVKTDAEAKERLNFSSTGSAFSHLKRRLKDDILGIFLVKESSKRIAQANRAAQFECLKKLTQAYVLLFRGAKEESSRILENVRELTVRYELIAESIQMQHLLRENFIGVGASAEFAKLNQQISSDMETYQALLVVEEKSILLSSPEYIKTFSKNKQFDEWGQRVEQIREYYEKYRLGRIGFWYFLVSTEYNAVVRNFEKVITEGILFLDLVENNPAVKSKNNVAGVNQTLGSAYLETRQYDKAIAHFSRAEQLFPSAGFNRLQCLQFLVLSEAACEAYDKGMKTILKALLHPRIDSREHLKPRWLFIKSSVEFLQGDVDLSFKTLNSEGYLMRQQDDWNLQFRLLEMAQLIAMKDEEWLEFKLDATRKFLTRHKNLDSLRTRVSIDVISNLLRKELDFSQISEKNRLLLSLCSEEAEGYEWNPMSPEIVRFDKWVLKQIPNQDRE
ncbi:MAG: tetratricopeptide repeat protein [Flavobacteriales bacterium]|nr:tetratricopeptide repeat protein [Flavobacteriales bacterium]